MSKLICLFALIISFSSFSAVPNATGNTLRIITDGVKEQLKDPDSAKFKNVKVSSASGYVCGEVNAKNSYGGYTGFTKFAGVYIGNTFIFLDMANDEVTTSTILTMCSEEGLL